MISRRYLRRDIDGIILLDKPKGITSNTALQRTRILLNARKGGHTGTLDPLATGVLPLCFGESTKFSKYLLDAKKSYRVLIQLGVTTSTGDSEGEVLDTSSTEMVCEANIQNTLSKFRGAIKQVPPMYSAIKHKGTPLYKIARAGKVVTRSPRSVFIEKMELLLFQADRVLLSVHCTKGTYVRTLVEDIGLSIGCGAHVLELTRLKSGPFNISETVKLETLEDKYKDSGNDSKALDGFLLPLDAGIPHWPLIHLSEDNSILWLQGQGVTTSSFFPKGMVRVRNHINQFIGIGEVLECNRLLPKRLLKSLV